MRLKPSRASCERMANYERIYFAEQGARPNSRERFGFVAFWFHPVPFVFRPRCPVCGSAWSLDPLTSRHTQLWKSNPHHNSCVTYISTHAANARAAVVIHIAKYVSPASYVVTRTSLRQQQMASAFASGAVIGRASISLSRTLTQRNGIRRETCFTALRPNTPIVSFRTRPGFRLLLSWDSTVALHYLSTSSSQLERITMHERYWIYSLGSFAVARSE